MRMNFFAALLALVVSPCVATPDDVACTQAYLTHLGHDAGAADGVLGPRTRAAAEAYLTATGDNLPELTQDSAAQWCARSRADTAYLAFLAFEYESYGIVPREVVFAALNAGESQRARACGPVRVLTGLDDIDPIRRISGFVSRMDNHAEVDGAREATAFANRFAQTTAAAFVGGDEEVMSGLVRILAKWARAGAFLDTESCVRRDGSLINEGHCREWLRDDGQDPSAQKDATFATFLMAGLVRNYLAFLAHHDPEGLAAEHRAIMDWIRNGFANRLKRPTQVYFGLNMGWYWPSINLDMVNGRETEARGKLAAIESSLRHLLRDDGSIKDRTTRGDRALWYHYTSIGEIVMSFEMIHAVGMVPDPGLETRLHAAVDLFLRALDDYTVIHPWARQRHSASYIGETQDWNAQSWQDSDFAGSWLYVYPYRYPDHPNADILRDKARWYRDSAKTDTDYGIGVGCLYTLASDRVPG